MRRNSQFNNYTEFEGKVLRGKIKGFGDEGDPIAMMDAENAPDVVIKEQDGILEREDRVKVRITKSGPNYMFGVQETEDEEESDSPRKVGQTNIVDAPDEDPEEEDSWVVEFSILGQTFSSSNLKTEQDAEDLAELVEAKTGRSAEVTAR